MKQTHSPIFSSLRMVAIVVGMACLPVYADDYSDVSQLVRGGKLAEALSRADQFLAAQPKDPQMRFIKGVIQRDSGKTAEAIATFTRLSEDYPNLPEPHNNLAVMYAAQSQFEKARDELEKAISTNPSYATAHENLGDIYAKLASQAYNKALQLDTANQAVPPKLALIHDIFSSNIATAARPNPTTSVAGSTPTTLAAANPATKPVASVVAPPVVVATAAKVPATASPSTPAVSPPAAAQTTPPVAPAKPVAPAVVDSNSAVQAKDVETAVAKWASVWSARDVKAYLASYGKEFDPPGSMSRKAWEEERTQRINGKASISVKIDNLQVSVNGNRAVAKFRQDYKAGGLAVSSHKTLDFAKVGDHWQIVKETVGN